ncbi:MAG: antibiotic ABC transporter ATP-binding protein [Flavobacteriaceae bacterium]|nr:antibiotic ABC transporter ATP-binding protein [Flavobacteriaceae bacterium]|tara:strand:- start:2670 stop:4493 length:1824 start_codon:yes stop_codon:yes gene_type:complete
MTYFWKIFRFAKPYSKYMALNIFFNVLYAFFNAFSFLVLMPMLEVLFGENRSVYTKPSFSSALDFKTYVSDRMSFEVTRYAGEDPQRALLLVISLILVTFLLKNLFNYIALFFITFLRNGILKDIRIALYNTITKMSMAHFTEKRKGDLMSRVSNDVTEIQYSFLSIIELLIREPLTIVFALLMMFSISAKLTLFVLLFVPFAGILITRIGKTLQPKSNKVQVEVGEVLAKIEETISGLNIIKAFRAEGSFQSKFRDTNQRLFKLSNSLINRMNLSSPLSEFLGISVFAVLLWYGGSLVLVEKQLNAAAFITFLGLAYGVLTPAKGISKALYSIKKGNAAAARILEVLETPNPIVDPVKPKKMSAFNKGVRFNEVSFAYEDELVIDKLNLTIPKGSSVALVGPSGGGKSTIANLVPRFYDVNEGSISIDGTDIRQFTKNDLRSLMGIVTQDSILFNDTVANNLRIAKPDATEKELKNAAEIANALSFIEALPKGFDTSIGDQGNKLSGGQKQRLSIARAVLKNPEILILDEATSALDTESERLVQEALIKMMKSRTSLVIAHRLSTIQNADLIVVLQNGKIAEKGTHEELIAKKGTYKKLIELQSFQ